jgi:hypothetical protein
LDTIFCIRFLAVLGATNIENQGGITMDVREKLLELLEEIPHPQRLYPDLYVDRIIEKGVTVQEWISVNDRLPEIVSTHKRYRSTIKKSIRVLCVCVQKSGKTMVKEGYCEWYNDYPEPRWQIPGTIDEVTHWAYLPQPPKGE